MTTSTTLLTAEDLFHMPDMGMKHELVRGELRSMAPAGVEHGNIGGELFVLLRQYAKLHDLGMVLGPDTGFYLSRDPDNVRAPDVSFVRKARIPVLPVQKFFPGAPDLAVEVVSPNDTVDELQEKIQDYLAHGVRLVWIIYPRTRTAEVHRPGQPPQHIPADGTLSGEDLLPGFECRVAELFV